MLDLFYVCDISERTQYVCYSLEISTAFKSSNILRQSLVHVKSCIPPEKNCFVYEIPCKDCKHLYINEMKRIQVMEHILTVRLQPTPTRLTQPGKKPTPPIANQANPVKSQPAKANQAAWPKASQPRPLPTRTKLCQPEPKPTQPNVNLTTRPKANQQEASQANSQPGHKANQAAGVKATVHTTGSTEH